MIIGEVKEGKPRLNSRAYSPPVIESIIHRFGCCDDDPHLVALQVIGHGEAETHVGNQQCRIRMLVFGGGVEATATNYDNIGLRHVVGYLNNFVYRHSDVFLAAQIKDESLDLMALLVKLGVRIDVSSEGDRK